VIVARAQHRAACGPGQRPVTNQTDSGQLRAGRWVGRRTTATSRPADLVTTSRPHHGVVAARPHGLIGSDRSPLDVQEDRCGAQP
jgi:hypothetical protein